MSWKAGRSHEDAKGCRCHRPRVVFNARGVTPDTRVTSQFSLRYGFLNGVVYFLKWNAFPPVGLMELLQVKLRVKGVYWWINTNPSSTCQWWSACNLLNAPSLALQHFPWSLGKAVVTVLIIWSESFIRVVQEGKSHLQWKYAASHDYRLLGHYTDTYSRSLWFIVYTIRCRSIGTKLLINSWHSLL